MINKIRKFIGSVIVSYVSRLIFSIKLLYLNLKLKLQKEKANESEKKSKDLKESSDNATNNFRVHLRQYRKGNGNELRQTVDRVRERSRKAGSNHSKSRRNDNVKKPTDSNSGTDNT